MSPQRFSHVLVVEENPEELQSLCHVLHEEGFQVIGCKSATEGLCRIQQHRVGVAIIEPCLSDLNGIQLLKCIRDCDDQVRVIIYTRNASYDSIKEALNLGAFAFVEKTSDPSELIRHVHRAVYERVDRYALDLERAVEERTEEIARSNGELENFAFSIAHDLRSPLLTIFGYSQILQEEFAARLDVTGNEYLVQIIDGASRMNRMIEGLLDYCRVGTVNRSLEKIDLSSVLTQAMANLESVIWKQGATVKCGSLPTVYGDSAQLVQLFQNLIGNAIKFQRNEKPVVQINAEPCDAAWKLVVEDNGIGIAPKNFPRLFHVFQRLHGREYPGTGIGLAICKKIVERHGGKIWVCSDVGKGAAFHFTLPKVKPPMSETTH
jgi:light-regulated signal transduction histidine kinase (bacteriophytochrome)